MSHGSAIIVPIKYSINQADETHAKVVPASLVQLCILFVWLLYGIHIHMLQMLDLKMIQYYVMVQTLGLYVYLT